MYKYRFSIFTATYNRASRLEDLAEMINNQLFKGPYEWVIVNDGSTDNTVDVVSNIMKNSNVPIKFINKGNGGKHTAWREATKVFEGRYVVTCDDDDPITLDMLEVFDKYWKILEKSSCYDAFWEVRSRSQYEDGRLVGLELPKPYFDSDYNEVTFKLHKGCEMVGCRKVEVLRNEAAVPDNFIFEEQCSNFPEGIRWSRAARKYKTRFVPDITCTYTIGHDSLCYTPKKGGRRSPKKNYNSLVDALYSLNEQGDLLKKYNYKQYLMTILQLAYSAIRVHKNIILEVNKKDRLLTMIAYLPGFFLYLVRRK